MKAIKFSVAAAAALAVSAFAADGDVLKPYGVISGEVGFYSINGTDGNGIDARSYASRFGLKGAHALDGGLTAVYQVEAGFNPVKGEVVSQLGATSSRVDADGFSGGGSNNNTGLSNRNSFVGVAGGFGTFLIGNHDTPYKLAARGSGAVSSADTVADLHLLTDRRLKGAIAYVAPAEAVGGATIAAAIVPAHTTDEDGDPRNDFSYSLGAVVPVDIITIGAGVEVANVSVNGAKDQVTETSFFGGVNAKLADRFTIGIAFEQVSDNNKLIANKGKASVILVPFTADLGEGLFLNAGVRYQQTDKKGGAVGIIPSNSIAQAAPDEDATQVSLAFGKNWGKDFTAYVGLKYTKSSVKVVQLDGEDTAFDFAAGLKVAFN